MLIMSEENLPSPIVVEALSQVGSDRSTLVSDDSQLLMLSICDS